MLLLLTYATLMFLLFECFPALKMKMILSFPNNYRRNLYRKSTSSGSGDEILVRNRSKISAGEEGEELQWSIAKHTTTMRRTTKFVEERLIEDILEEQEHIINKDATFNSSSLVEEPFFEVVKPPILLEIAKSNKRKNVKTEAISGVWETLTNELSGGLVKEFVRGHYLAEPIEWAIRTLLFDVAYNLWSPILHSNSSSQSHDSSQPGISNLSSEDILKNEVINEQILYTEDAFESQSAAINYSLRISLIVPEKDIQGSAPPILLKSPPPVTRNLPNTPEVKNEESPHDTTKNSLTKRFYMAKGNTTQDILASTLFFTTIQYSTISIVKAIVVPIIMHAIAHTLSSATLHTIVEQLPSLSHVIDDVINSE